MLDDDLGELPAGRLSPDALPFEPTTLIDGTLPKMPRNEGMKSRQKLIIDHGRRENLSIRGLARHFAGARGHWQVVGTFKQVADAMEKRFLAGAANGFNIMPPLFPSGLEDFVNEVVPELQRRGLFRQQWEYGTLCENLGLPPL